jgi:archaellum component FlaC
MGGEEVDIVPSKPTTASVDRRVENLEKQVTELRLTVTLVESEQKHIRELMTAQFGSINASLSALMAKLDKLSSEVAVADRATKDYETIRETVDDNNKFIQQVVGAMKGLEQARIWVFGGGIMVFFISLIGLLHSLGFIGDVK